MESLALLGGEDTAALDEEITAAERRVAYLRQKLADLEDLLGAGTDADRKRRKEQIIAVQAEQAGSEVGRRRRPRAGGGTGKEPVTQQRVKAELASLLELLDAAAAGRLGVDVVGKAADLFERLTGGAVVVDPALRPGRKRWLVRGWFVRRLLVALKGAAGADADAAGERPDAGRGEITVWLREPPRVDRIAGEVHHLYDVERLGFRVINCRPEEKYGEPSGSGNCRAAWHRWHEQRGLSVPPPRTNTGRPRRKAG